MKTFGIIVGVIGAALFVWHLVKVTRYLLPHRIIHSAMKTIPVRRGLMTRMTPASRFATADEGSA